MNPTVERQAQGNLEAALDSWQVHNEARYNNRETRLAAHGALLAPSAMDYTPHAVRDQCCGWYLDRTQSVYKYKAYVINARMRD